MDREIVALTTRKSHISLGKNEIYCIKEIDDRNQHDKFSKSLHDFVLKFGQRRWLMENYIFDGITDGCLPRWIRIRKI